MIRIILHHLLFLGFLLNKDLGASAAYRVSDEFGSSDCKPPTNSSQMILPCHEVNALWDLLNYLGNDTATEIVDINFCSNYNSSLVFATSSGSIQVDCDCSTSVCHIQDISAYGSSGLSSSSSSSSDSYSSSATTTISPSVTGLKFLKSLTLSRMSLQSSILDCLGNLTALEHLDLSNNQFLGNIPTNIGNLTSLVYLDLSYNQLSGEIPTGIGSLSSLEKLYLEYNLLEGSIPDLKNLVNLTTLSLSVNRLHGSIPDALGKQIFNLQYIRLYENRLNGSLQPELGKLAQLEAFDVGSNNLTGNIPKTMFDKLPSLWYFSVYGNKISGEIPGDIAKCTSLEYLYLIGNNFHGPLHNDIFKMWNLEVLAISDLQKDSTAIPEDANLTQISKLTLRNCNLSGKIPNYIWNNNYLHYLDLSFNDNLEKHLPDKLTRKMSDIALGSNALGEESFQSQRNTIFFRKRRTRVFMASLDHQQTGTNETFYSFQPPSCSEGNHRTSLFINCGGGQLKLKGTQYESDNDTANLYRSDTPALWAYSCRGLSDSDESVRNLSCALGFSDTTLYATARVCPVSLEYYGFCLRNGKYDVTLHFAEIEYVKDEDYSSLRKRIFDIYIQKDLVRKDFSIVDEAGEPAKDVPLQFQIDIKSHTLEIQLYWAGKGTLVDGSNFNGVLISGISVVKRPLLNRLEIAFIAIACVVFLGIIILALAWQQGWIGDKELYEKRIDIRGKKFTVKQLIKATQNFSRKREIGGGGFGTVYKAELAGQVIAVKKLSPRSKQGILEFRHELYSLKSLRHPNFVELLDGYSGHGFHLLIYEYMENKSLADVLFDPNLKQKLNWEVRYKICKDIAIGLKYLHEESHLNMIHGDIKASNILLDGELKAKISDFGLAKIYIEDDQATVVKVGGTSGYMAPEYASQGLLSHKIDVYSFGVVLLEIVSGKKNTEYKPSEESEFLLDSAYVLHKKGKSMNLVDEDLRDDLTEQESHEAKSVLLLAMMCVSLSPSLRPTMSEVVNVLEGEKTIEQVSSEYETTSTSRSIGNTTKRLGQRNWSSTDYTPGSTDISSVATTTYFVIKEKDGKDDQSQGSSLEMSHNIRKEQQQQQQDA